MSKLLSKLLIFLCCIILISGCQIDPNAIAHKANMHKKLHYTKNFIITSFIRERNYLDQTKPIYIYIEGDGQAWVSRYRLSNNPTPKNPLALQLASIDHNANVIYIARPCQFTPIELDHNCCSNYWSTARYSQVVIDAINEVITNVKNLINSKNPDIHLIGYSGGATVAGIIAASRNDIKSLTTIAGNLDHDMVSDFHQTTKLDQSLNLIDFAEKISNISQIHYIGEKDQVIPSYITKIFVTKINYFNKNNIAKYVILKNIDHYNGWVSFWKTKNI
jgi:hypothetical protein